MNFQIFTFALIHISSLFAIVLASPIAKPRSLGADHALETLTKSLVEGIIGGIQQDDRRREEYTQGLVREMRAQFPEFNWVICHPEHDYKFDGERGVDWGHKHEEFDLVIGGTVGYEIYNFRSGEFTRHGDGGFINWAFNGNVLTRDQDGAHVVFGAN
ncbi:hypothetical protein EYR40_003741 [Pleurotus pulmonarius]|nr:hypothetical protein EYR40_003741 [Pleurotus pulmonarius]KAF4606451.1 hypothetical protein EYR38_000505 [Pleurotus pulmonarius]